MAGCGAIGNQLHSATALLVVGIGIELLTFRCEVKRVVRFKPLVSSHVMRTIVSSHVMRAQATLWRTGRGSIQVGILTFLGI